MNPTMAAFFDALTNFSESIVTNMIKYANEMQKNYRRS